MVILIVCIIFKSWIQKHFLLRNSPKLLSGHNSTRLYQLEKQVSVLELCGLGDNYFSELECIF